MQVVEKIDKKIRLPTRVGTHTNTQYVNKVLKSLNTSFENQVRCLFDLIVMVIHKMY